jgi:hypothetical protein
VALARHHVPFDGIAHVVMLGGEPEALAVGHADDEDPGIIFYAEPGDRGRVFRVFGWGEFLPAGGAVLIGEARTGHGLRMFLYEMPGQQLLCAG